MTSKFMRGGTFLSGNNTIPGELLTPFEKEIFSKTLQICTDYGLDYYPTIIHKLKYNEMSEIAAYGGFPNRFPHWKWGMEYEDLQRGYEYGMQKIFELVINCVKIDTKILTKRGTVLAKDVRIGDEVIVGNGTREVMFVKRQRKSKVLRVKLKYGQDLVCTSDHKWRVLEGGLVWRRTEELAVGDLLIGSDSYESFQGKKADFQLYKDPPFPESGTKIPVFDCIPQEVWESSSEHRAVYLKSLFDSMGYVSGLCGLACHPGLANDIQVMLTEMGIQTILETRYDTLFQCYISWINIRSRPALIKFRDRIGFKKDKVNALCNMSDDERSNLEFKVRLHEADFHECKKRAKFEQMFTLEGLKRRCNLQDDEFAEFPKFEVSSVEPDGEAETVDIALDHNAHDFVANGLITHNTSPCRIYLLGSNTLVDNVTVVAHATGHNHFFKNNIRFTPTNTNMMNQFANHGNRIRKYMDRWGFERVTEFIDQVMRIQTLVDVAKSWDTREIGDVIIQDSREYEHPVRFPVAKDHLYMDSWINSKEWVEKENKRIERKEAAEDIGIFGEPTKDIMGYIKDNAPLKPWQADIVSILYEEALYFAPQRATKVTNEGFASYVDFEIMVRQGHCSLGQKTHDAGIVHYALHKTSVLGSKYGMNPYMLGFYLLLDIEERWNKGQFGSEWDNCKDARKKEAWDLKLGLGKQKVFEVVKYYDDVTLVQEFFTQAFCQKYEFFEWKKYPNGKYQIENRGDTPEGFKKIKTQLMQKHLNGGLPDIRLADPNHRGKGKMFLQHWWDGRVLHEPYVRDVLTSIRFLWQQDVLLATKDSNSKEVVFVCNGHDSDKNVQLLSRTEYEKVW